MRSNDSAGLRQIRATFSLEEVGSMKRGILLRVSVPPWFIFIFPYRSNLMNSPGRAGGYLFHLFDHSIEVQTSGVARGVPATGFLNGNNGTMASGIENQA